MERRKAVIAAATASLTLLAGAAAISLNTSLVGASGNDGVGQVSPVDPTTIPSTISIDEPAPPQTRPSSPSRSGDDEFNGEDERDEDDHGDDPAGYVDDDHEYEGADDDD